MKRRFKRWEGPSIRSCGGWASFVAWRTALVCAGLIASAHSCTESAAVPSEAQSAAALCVALSSAPVIQLSAPETVNAAVWVITEPSFADPPIVNFAESRINGQQARVVSWNQATWYALTDEADGRLRYALRLLHTSQQLVTGQMAVCDQHGTGPTLGRDPAPRSERFVARPLAPRHAEGSGFVNLAQYPTAARNASDGDCRSDGKAGQWPSERSSDLALLGSSLLVVARGSDGLRILDVSRAQAGVIEERAHLRPAAGDDFNDVVGLTDALIAVASRSKGLAIYDLSDPASPALVDQGLPLAAPRDGHNVFVSDHQLFLAQAPVSGTGALVAFDISTPTRPQMRWRAPLADGHDAHDSFVAEDTAYVASLRGGLYALDVNNGHTLARFPASATGDAGAHSIALLPPHGSHSRLLVTDERVAARLRLLAIRRTDPADTASRALAQTWPSEMDATTIESAAAPHKLQCVAELCFVAFYQLGLRVLDFGQGVEPLSPPALKAWFPSWSASAANERNWLQGATGVALDLPFVYLLDTCAGVVVLELQSVN